MEFNHDDWWQKRSKKAQAKVFKNTCPICPLKPKCKTTKQEDIVIDINEGCYYFDHIDWGDFPEHCIKI